MATFTIELWKVLELYPSEDYSGIGLNDYPIFDSDYRKTLNELIVNHYHNREIGQETVEMFRFAMRRKMHEIMPYYNELFKSQRLEFDPLATIDMRTLVSGESTQNAESSSEGTTTSNTESGSRSVNSQTPQVMLAGNKDYATSAVDATGTNTGEGTSSEVSQGETRDHSESESHTTGYQGVPSELLQAYRASIINVNLMVIDELAELFMLIWNNGDDYFRRKGTYYR